MADRNSLTAARLRELLHYDPLTGIFTRVAPLKGQTVGDVAGCLNKKDGYVRVSVDGWLYYAHQLAWLHENGEWAMSKIDHRDTVRSHNWIDNLRKATTAQNAQNQRHARAGSRSGLLGVSWDEASGCWHARIKIPSGTHRNLGGFDDPVEAHEVYLAEKAVVHPYQTIVVAQ